MVAEDFCTHEGLRSQIYSNVPVALVVWGLKSLPYLIFRFYPVYYFTSVSANSSGTMGHLKHQNTNVGWHAINAPAFHWLNCVKGKNKTWLVSNIIITSPQILFWLIQWSSSIDLFIHPSIYPSILFQRFYFSPYKQKSSSLSYLCSSWVHFIPWSGFRWAQNTVLKE